MTPFQRSEGIYVAAIFTAEVTHWKKNRNLYESFIFILARVKGNVLGRAVGRDLPSALTLSEAWRFPSRWPAVFSPSGLHVLLSAPLCPQRVCSSYLLGCGYPEAQTGQARRETAWRGLFEVLMGGSAWDLTLSSSRLASLEDRLCHLPAGWPRSQQVTLIKSHHTTRQPCNGYKTSWDLLCQSWSLSLQAQKEKKKKNALQLSRGCLSSGACVSLGDTDWGPAPVQSSVITAVDSSWATWNCHISPVLSAETAALHGWI